jgi:hypothetical protein
MSGALPRLASLANGQMATLIRHINEHEFQHNVADVVMIMDGIHGLQDTFKKIEDELRQEHEEARRGHERI